MWIVTIYIAPLFFSLFATHTQKGSSTITKYDTFYLSLYTYMRMYQIISKSAVKTSITVSLMPEHVVEVLSSTALAVCPPPQLSLLCLSNHYA